MSCKQLNSSDVILAYIKDRYDNLGFDCAELCQGYKVAMARLERTIEKKPYGFFIWSSQGDSLVIHDVWTSPSYRNKGYSKSLFWDVKQLAKKLGKTTLIGFSEKIGDESRGRGSMQAVGFKPSYETLDQTIFIRGTD